MSKFKLHSKFKPSGSQPEAITALTKGIKENKKHQTLLGVTGSGKTFTIAKVIENIQRPTLVIAHNKTLAAQLASEFREFFPDNAVHYFVSYYDYYQPEAYMPITDTYIEKDAQTNKEIDRLRHASTQSLLTRDDVIVVASVSAIYGLGNPKEYSEMLMKVRVGEKDNRADFIRKLINIYFERTNADLTPSTFRCIGNRIEVMPSSKELIYRIEFSASSIVSIQILNSITRSVLEDVKNVHIFPAKHFVTPEKEREVVIKEIAHDLKIQLTKLKRAGRNLDAERLSRRSRHDLALIREVGFCNGVENYSKYFDKRKTGEPPYTLIDYFKSNSRDFITVIDESHVTVPQIGGMYAGDRARKETLVKYGFRLPSALDNRPLNFEEFQEKVAQTIYVSATPSKYELEHSGDPACPLHGKYAMQDHAKIHKNIKPQKHPKDCSIIEQIIRPTGLIDPEIIVRPITGSKAKPSGVPDGRPTQPVAEFRGQVPDFITEAQKVTNSGARTLVTVLTKKMAEDLTDFLREKNIKAEYIHSDIKTFQRIEIMTNFRKGEFDILVGVNLLREGLDLPEVELVAILDADKEGFLRSDTALIQTIGRAARNIRGRVILYADSVTGSMQRAIDETERRRDIQATYNKKHSITPKSIQKAIKDISDQFSTTHQKAVGKLVEMDKATAKNKQELKKLIKDKQKTMLQAAKDLDFETAALLRDEIKILKNSV